MARRRSDVQVDPIDEARPEKAAWRTIFTNTGICHLIFHDMERRHEKRMAADADREAADRYRPEENATH